MLNHGLLFFRTRIEEGLVTGGDAGIFKGHQSCASETPCVAA